ncbi:L-fuconolactonase [Rhizobium sp. PP-F2F-G20b]|nr:L-fuconolactonase [Rhizobium sp. PP-F2F-G20b]TCP75715.1 L-fuconolactonase [Rhizobium sp. PP-CC-2G-626]
MIIDAHQHFWSMAARAGAWPPAELATIHRDFEPSDLAPLLATMGVDGTVVVQSLDRDDDTAFLLALSDVTPFVLGVVGWVDLLDPAAPVQIARLAAHPKFKGVRPMLQDIAETDWILNPKLTPAIEALTQHALTFDALVTPRHLAPLLRFARRHPDLPIVIDHGAKPPIALGHFVAWRRAMSDLAVLPNVHCKLSGLLTEAEGENQFAAVRPYAETILDLFGAARTIWGSDWPVVRLAAEYSSWFEHCRDIVPDADTAAVFGGNARSFYRLAAQA